MKKNKYSPKEFKEIVSKLLSENHEICRFKGLPNTFFKSANGVDVLSNFDNVFNSFVREFPLTDMMTEAQVIFTYKILLQQQLDDYWYTGFKTYNTNLEIYNDSELINFKDRDNKFKYLDLDECSYKCSRIKKLFLKIVNSPLRNSSGLFLPYAPLSMYNFLNKLCEDLDIPLVITNTIRSIEYQERLIKKGHITPKKSSHLYGYSVDIEQKWYKKSAPHQHKKIELYLKKLEELGEVNFIDYGHIWHVCLSPYTLYKYLN